MVPSASRSNATFYLVNTLTRLISRTLEEEEDGEGSEDEEEGDPCYLLTFKHDHLHSGRWVWSHC